MRGTSLNILISLRGLSSMKSLNKMNYVHRGPRLLPGQLPSYDRGSGEWMRGITANTFKFIYYLRQFTGCLSVCLFVCWQARKSSRSDHYKKFTGEVSLDKEVTVRFQKSSGSESGSENFLKEFLLLWGGENSAYLLSTNT